jgi:bifunctional non-homologous end joining protein LigD
LEAGVTAIELVPSLLEKFENVVNEGLEGLMFKEISGLYGIGKRSGTWLKLKRFESVEGFITGYLPGSNAWTGLVGALLVSAYLPNGELFEFAAVSGFDFELRKAMTADDGSLREGYLGLVVEIRGQERSKSRRYRHAVLYRWRSDRTPESCFIDN